MFKLSATKASLVRRYAETLTTGMVGAEVGFSFSPEFDGLTKTAVFSDGVSTPVDVLLTSSVCPIPSEVLTTAGRIVRVGVYATDGATTVIPTIYCELETVLPGADPSGDPAADPTSPIYEQTVDLIKASMAPAYDPDETYALNAYCSYEWKIYKCSTAIDPAEAWNSAHWTAIALTTEMVALLAEKVNTSFIVNDLTTGGTAVPLSAEQGKTLNAAKVNTAHLADEEAHSALFAAKQDMLTIDATPTPGSTNPVESGGTAIALGAITAKTDNLLITNPTNNVAVGVGALNVLGTTREAVAIGYQALYYNNPVDGDTGRYNTAVGYFAMRANTTGHHSTALGWKALAGNTTGVANTGIGEDALLTNTTGTGNTAVGAHSLYLATTAASNTAVGNNSLSNNTTGYSNTAIGESSGISTFGSVGNCTTDNRMCFIGMATSVDKSVNAGPFTNSAAIGYGAKVDASNLIQLGNASVTSVRTHGDFEAQDVGDGFICKSPDGTRYRITVANGGAIAVAAA